MRFCARFADVFGRKEPQQAQATKYLRGLLASLPRKNGWQMAEEARDNTPDATQRLLYQAQGRADAARDRLLRYEIEVSGDAEGIGVVDEYIARQADLAKQQSIDCLVIGQPYCRGS